MYESLFRMLKKLKIEFAKPDYDLGSEKYLDEADRVTEDIKRRRLALERRLRLLGIQGTPRGHLDE